MGVLHLGNGAWDPRLFAFDSRGEYVALPLLQQWDPDSAYDMTAGQILELCFQQLFLGARIVQIKWWYD